METPLTAEAGNNEAHPARNSNSEPFDPRQSEDTINNSSYITVYSNQTLRRLLVISVSAILCEIIQFICQVCLIMQSRRLSVSSISAVLVIWTLLALTLTAQWIIVLGSNRVAIVKKGKMLICGCQGLGVLSLLASVALLSVQNEGNKWAEDVNTQWLVGVMVGTNCLNVITFCVIFVFIVRGQKSVHQVIGSWLWLAIQQHMQVNHYCVTYDPTGELTLCYLTAEVMWESSDWWLIQSQPRRVLPATSVKLGLSLTILNTILWLIAVILQALLLNQIDYHILPSAYTLVGICLGWSATILVATAGSLYGLIRNTGKDVKSYLVLTASTASFSLIIFIAYVIVLCLDTATESWLGPSGFSIFTGLYVSGESCIVLWYFARQWKAYHIEIEEEKMDRIQQRVREQQNHHLAVLTHSLQPPPPSECQVNQVMDTIETQVEVMQEEMEEVSDAGSDRLTYYPPVFV